MMFSTSLRASSGLVAILACGFSKATRALSSATIASVRVVPNDKLHVSEPHPSMFGNGPNPTGEAASSWSHTNWLQSRFHFSFADYYNGANTNFGVLRVMNDDLVQPHRQFGSHPHRNMEIVTYVVDGELTHQDNMGTKETLGRGSVQYMTAGTGVVHSEANHGDKPLRFIQTWILPRLANLEPQYGSYAGDDASLRRNQLQHLVSSVDSPTAPVSVHQDVDAFASELEQGQSVSLDLGEDRQAYLLCIEGSVKVNGNVLAKHDACEITGQGSIEIEAIEVEETEGGQIAHILMYTMSAVSGSGRTDL